MIVYGRNTVREALRGPREVSRVWATSRVARAGWLEEATVSTCSDDELTVRCQTDDHQGVCAEVSPYVYQDAQALLEVPDAVVVCCDEIQDPQNLGAICRTAECAGAHGVVVCERRAAHVTPAVCKASAGAVEHLAVARVRNLADYLKSARQAGAWVYGAESAARRNYKEPDYTGPALLVLGSEGRGLRRRVRDTCDELVSVPVVGRIDSLNVSAAAAVILYEILQTRRPT